METPSKFGNLLLNKQVRDPDVSSAGLNPTGSSNGGCSSSTGQIYGENLRYAANFTTKN
jgi:hypothetical protein